VETQELIDGLKRVDSLLHRKYWRGAKVSEKPLTLMLMGKLARSQMKDPDGGVRVSQLAADFGITSSGITQAVTQLEERGFVGRKMDPEDRRAVLVFLTDQGKTHLAALMSALDEILTGLVEHLGQDRSRLFLDILDDVTRYLENSGSDESQKGESC